MQKTEKFQFCDYADLLLFCNEELRKMLHNEKMPAQIDGELIIFLIGRLSTKPSVPMAAWAFGMKPTKLAQAPMKTSP